MNFTKKSDVWHISRGKKNNTAFLHTWQFLPCDDVIVIFLDVALWLVLPQIQQQIFWEGGKNSGEGWVYDLIE